MKLLTFLILTLLLNAPANADQAATLTCEGSNIVLKEKSPYLGENSKYTQSLFVLTSKNQQGDESANTAYFLSLSYDKGKYGMVYISGKNEVGGFFDLVTSNPQDESDGTVVREVSRGELTYSHGPLKGKKESVVCVKE